MPPTNLLFENSLSARRAIIAAFGQDPTSEGHVGDAAGVASHDL